jgi:hypothetical protein
MVADSAKMGPERVKVAPDSAEVAEEWAGVMSE